MEHPDDKLEKFYARILFSGDGTNDLYIYNREVFDGVFKLKHHKEDNSQFIEIGDILTVYDKRYKVKSINIKLDDHIHDMVANRGYGVNASSPSEPTNFNLQIGVFVEPA